MSMINILQVRCSFCFVAFRLACIHYYGIKIFNSVLPSVRILKIDKAKSKAALRKYIHTQSIYSVDDFLCIEMMYNIFVKCL